MATGQAKGQWLSHPCQLPLYQAQLPFYQGRPWPLCQGQLAPHKQFIKSRPATRLIEAGPDGKFIKANPMAVLARKNLTTLLSLEGRSDIAPRKQFVNGQPYEAKPIAVLSRQALTTVVYRSQWPLYQSQWPFYQGRPFLGKRDFRGKNLWV